MTDVSAARISPDHGQLLEEGDRVSRVGQFANELAKLGTVVRCYQSRPNLLGATLDMYTVDWDGGYHQTGYLRVGLQLVERKK